MNIGPSLRSAACAAVVLLAPALGSAAELSLREAVRQALDSNLDLAAQRRALAADREEIRIARSSLLPQVGFDTDANYLDSERPHDNRGVSTKESVTVGADLTQVIYDENAWAGYQIQQRVYEEQQAEFVIFEQGVVQEAADAFIELDRARVQLDVQQRNRALTASNLETSRARIAAGYSSRREVLRWESQLAANERAVVNAEVDLLAARFELNRVRNLPLETLITPAPAGIEEYGFVYSRKRIADAISTPEGDRRMRDYLARVGIARSPDLAALDASLEAAERLLTANRRAFWVPSLSFKAGVNHLAANGGGDPTFNKTEWGVGLGLDLPLLEGGARWAQLSQTQEGRASLSIQRRSEAQSVEQAVRQAFAQASGSYANVGHARSQERTARRNFKLVDESYQLGVASILSLLDAQSQLLNASLAATNAHYQFLRDLVAAERAISLYPFTLEAGEVEQLLNGLERELAIRR